MKFCQIFGVLLFFVVQIWHGTALEVLPSTDSVSSPAPLVKEHGFIEIMIQKLNMNNFVPVNIEQIGQTLQYCTQRMETITALIVTQYPKSSAENLLSLLSTIREVFDAISVTANMLESSLNGIVGCVDLAVLDVQIALQVLVEALISNCEDRAENESPTDEAPSDEAIASAVYCLSSAVKTLLTSMSQLVEKLSVSTVMIDANVPIGLQMIVQTVLNIVDRVLYCVRRVNVLDLDGVVPSLEKFSLIIQRLANQRLTFVSPMIIAPIAEVVDSLKSTVDRQLPEMSRKNVDRLVTALTNVEDVLHEKNISENINTLLEAMQPMLVQLSTAIHSFEGITDAVAYSTDLSLQNLMALIKCLTYYVAVLTKVLPDIEASAIGTELQTMLCFIASTIQTLVDGVTVAAERALIDLICLSPTLDKTRLEQQLHDLQASMEPIFLTLENVIMMSMKLVQNILNLGVRAMADESSAVDLTSNMNMLINNLQRIVKEIMESALRIREVQLVDNQIDRTADGAVTVTNDDNLLAICVAAFETVARNSMKLRVYVNESIDEIRRYLIQM